MLHGWQVIQLSLNGSPPLPTQEGFSGLTVSSIFQQNLDYFKMSMSRCNLQRTFIVIANCVYVDPMSDEQLNNLLVAIASSKPKGRRSMLASSLNISRSVQEKFNNIQMTIPASKHDWSYVMVIGGIRMEAMVQSNSAVSI